MAKQTIRVRATAPGFGGNPPGPRGPGEVFDVPATKIQKVWSDPDDKGRQKLLEQNEVPNTASWYEPIGKETPIGKPPPAKAVVPEFERKDGVYVEKSPPVEGQGSDLA